MITKVVLYYRGQCSNATVGVGVGRKVTIVLRDVEKGRVEMDKGTKMTEKNIGSYTILVQ